MNKKRKATITTVDMKKHIIEFEDERELEKDEYNGVAIFMVEIEENLK